MTESFSNIEKMQLSPKGLGFFFRASKAIAWVTLREITRDKIFYNTILFALVLFGAGFLASQLTYGDPGRVVLDFGISAVNISCTAIGMILGSSVLIKEFDRRTALVALAHPVSRGNFLVGKFLGVCGVLLINWSLLAICLVLILVITGGASHTVTQVPFLAALGLIFWESVVMAAIAILFSTITTTSLSFIISVGFYLIGHSNTQLRLLAGKASAPVSKAVMNGLAYVLPNLEHFNLGFKVTYNLPLEPGFVWLSTGYALAWIAFLLVLASILLEKKET